MIEGWEWIIVVAYVLSACLGTYLILSVRGDIRMKERSGTSDDEQAEDAMIDLINKTRRELIIHDDGNDSSGSVYNNDRVLEAMKKRLNEYPNLRIRCLFNDNAQLKLLGLARSERGGIDVWHTGGSRPPNDTHYKIVDNGKIVHLSKHEHGANERKYLIRVPPRWARRTQRRISKVYRKHFKAGIKAATKVV